MNKSNIFLVLLTLWAGSAFGMESGLNYGIEPDSDIEYESAEEGKLSDSDEDESNEAKTSNFFASFLPKENGAKNDGLSKEFLVSPSEQDKQMYQELLETAPDKIKAIIQRELLHPNGYKHRVNRLLFIGVPGVAKSLLAKAMACQIGQCYFLKHGEFMKKYRNETSDRLNKVLKEIVKNPGKNIVLIDEINKLTDNHKSENSDSGITAATLWTFLDDQQTNPNFFLIGTTNHSKKLPVELQSRFHSATVTITVPDANTRRNLIRRLILESEVQCAPNMEDSFNRLVERTENYSIRDLIQLIWDVENFAYQLHINKPCIDQECLERALLAREDEDRNAWDTKQMSDEEKRHEESMQISREGLQQARQLHNANEQHTHIRHAQSMQQARNFQNENEQSANGRHGQSFRQARDFHDANEQSANERHTQSMEQARDFHDINEQRTNLRHTQSIQQTRDLHIASEGHTNDRHDESSTVAMMPMYAREANAIAYTGARLLGVDTGPAHSFGLRQLGVLKERQNQ